MTDDFWRGRCPECMHPAHPMTCHELLSNGDPSNGPDYCPCAAELEHMEQEIVRLFEAGQEIIRAHDAFRGTLIWADGEDGIIRVHRAAERLREVLAPLHGPWCVQDDKGDSAEPFVHGPTCHRDETPAETVAAK